MKIIKYCFLLIVIPFLPISLFGQQTDLIWEPAVSYSWQPTDNLTFTAKISAFNSIRDFDNKTAIRYAEPKFLISYGMTESVSLTGGYYYRWVAPLMDSDAYEHRFLQQIGFKTYISERSFSNRLRYEQRVRSSSYQNRIRYRLSHKIQLQNSANEIAKYVLISDEVMTAFNRDFADAENRFAFGFGWLLNKKQFEAGIQYRTQDIFHDNGISHMLLLFTSLSIK